jgi:protein-S-isoprenylcysteine O-methyltransferase Ste14
LGPDRAWDWAPLYAIGAIWGAWLLSWLVAAVWTGRTAARPVAGSQVVYRLTVVAGAILLFDRFARGRAWPLWRSPSLLGWAMVALTAGGFIFCWWARLYLGRLWSSAVTLKDGHHVVDTGPYALVRHPIYTGILIAAAATAVEQGTAISFMGLALMTLGYWIKARLEESFLREELGGESYDAYARRTGMLLPFL